MTANLDELSREIANRERIFDNLSSPVSGTGYAIAHARKEFGHACGVPDGDSRAFFVGIVCRDLAVFDKLMSQAAG